MSNLMIPRECADWVNSWKAVYLNRPSPNVSGLIKKLESTLEEQTLNRKGMRHQYGTEWEEYGKSLEILSYALDEAKKLLDTPTQAPMKIDQTIF
jgi:hypothetical protein